MNAHEYYKIKYKTMDDTKRDFLRRSNRARMRALAELAYEYPEEFYARLNEQRKREGLGNVRRSVS